MADRLDVRPEDGLHPYQDDRDEEIAELREEIEMKDARIAALEAFVRHVATGEPPCEDRGRNAVGGDHAREAARLLEGGQR